MESAFKDSHTELALLIGRPSTRSYTVVVASFSIESIRFDKGVVAEAFHVSAPVGSILSDLENFIDICVHAVIPQIDDFPEWSAVYIEKSGLICTEQELSISFSAHLLIDWQCFVLVSSELFYILATRQNRREQAGECLSELIHSYTHLSSLKWVTWNQLDPAIRVLLKSPLLNDATLGYELACGGLQNRSRAAIEINMPLSLLIKIDLA